MRGTKTHLAQTALAFNPKLFRVQSLFRPGTEISSVQEVAISQIYPRLWMANVRFWMLNKNLNLSPKASLIFFRKLD
jgi:hypothetical protein